MADNAISPASAPQGRPPRTAPDGGAGTTMKCVGGLPDVPGTARHSSYRGRWPALTVTGRAAQQLLRGKAGSDRAPGDMSPSARSPPTLVIRGGERPGGEGMTRTVRGEPSGRGYLRGVDGLGASRPLRGFFLLPHPRLTPSATGLLCHLIEAIRTASISSSAMGSLCIKCISNWS